MKKWKALVCVPMWQEVEVEAKTRREAEATMLDLFDMSKAGPGEAYVYDLEELKGESK
jgi:hypothetical protein